MVLDSEDHRVILLEMLDRMQFQGSARRLIFELGDAIERASVMPPQAALAEIGVVRVEDEA